MISAVDDSENVYVFFFNQETRTSNIRNINIKRAAKISKDNSAILNKHFFGMGYPYFICGYDNHVAVTSDYGILLFSLESK